MWDQDFYEDILDNAHNVRTWPCFPNLGTMMTLRVTLDGEA